FWFNEKECKLNYYKNNESYIQYVHMSLGEISMDDTKVSPAAAYEHESNEDTSNTFIILTHSGQIFALTAESAEICHDWIRNLQISPRHYDKVSGLVGGDRSFGNSLGMDLLRTTGNGSVSVRKIFIDQLEGKLSPCNDNSPNFDYALENGNLRVVIESLQKSLKSLDGEVELHKLKLKERNSEPDLQKDRMCNMQKELMSFKYKYVTLLSSSLKIHVQMPTPAGLTSIDNVDPFEEKLKDEVINLISEEDTSSDSFLAAIKTGANFEDQFGDIHDWKEDSNIYRFLCRQLYLHYTAAEQDMLSIVWHHYVNGLKKGSDQYQELPTDRTKKREFCNYLRKGIPLESRSQIWSSIINHHIGKC
uniref:PH domain-containing protein n=1 Tax=Amphimedon queenslandica TaxID=400682 RepID=A0A1X7VBB1_AMPQE